VTWDETRALNCAIGDLHHDRPPQRPGLVCRRHTGRIRAQHGKWPLSFLNPDQEYEATLYVDGKGADWEKKSNPRGDPDRKVRASDNPPLASRHQRRRSNSSPPRSEQLNHGKVGRSLRLSRS